MNRKKLIFYFINIFIPLSIGFLFYCLYDRNTYINDIFPLYKTIYYEKRVYYIMSNWGCDFLWAYALFFSWYWYIKNHTKTLFSTLIIATILELLQLIKIDGIKCGTFDWYDIIIEFTGSITAMLVNYFFEKKKGIKKYGK